MVPLVALLAFRQTGVTADEAMAAGTRILTAFDVSGPYARVSAHDSNAWGSPTVAITLKAYDAVTYVAIVYKETGRCALVYRNDA